MVDFSVERGKLKFAVSANVRRAGEARRACSSLGAIKSAQLISEDVPIQDLASSQQFESAMTSDIPMLVY